MIVVFDLGGVLFEWAPRKLLADVMPGRVRDDVEASHWAHAFFQSHDGDWAEFDRGSVDVDELVRPISTRTGLAAHEVQAVVDAVPAALRPKADTVAWLARLRDAGHRLHYLSNMPAPLADHLLRTHHFMGWFRSGVFSSHVGCIKPERRIFDLAAAQWSLDPGAAVFLDDHPPNVEAARAAGWQALHFTDAAAAESAMEALRERR